MTANARLRPTLQLGLEYNPAAGEVGPLATWFIVTESVRRPAVFVGTSSDRIGSPPHTQSYYVTMAKRVDPIRTSPYASLNYSEWDEGLNLPFGANVDLGHGLSVQPMYDGNRAHLLGSFATGRFSATLIWAWLERAGVALSAGF